MCPKIPGKVAPGDRREVVVEQRTRRVLVWSVAGLLGVAVLIGAVGFVVLWKVLNPTDCYDHDAVDLLAQDPVESVRPRDAELLHRPEGPTCSAFEPRMEEPSRGWWFLVRDPGRVTAVVDDLQGAAEHLGWRPATDPVDGSTYLTRDIDGRAAELRISALVVEPDSATGNEPAGSVRIRVETSFAS